MQSETPDFNSFHKTLSLLELDNTSENVWYHILTTIAQKIFEKKTTDDTFLVGISGAQGSGKTTLATLLQAFLKARFSWKVAHISLDDYYLSHQQRLQLSLSIHPLLQTRGVPGTHNIKLLQDTLHKLSHAKSNELTIIQRFNKLTDNPFPLTQCEPFHGKADVILLEGWCLGASPQTDTALQIPINHLEKEEDPHCIWRKFVNDQLKNSYNPLFQQVQYLIYINIPSFDKIYEWRGVQEQKLAKNHLNIPQKKVMPQQELTRFIAHFERITRLLMQTMPQKADLVLQMSEQHQPYL